MKPSFLADHFKSISVPQDFQTMHLPHGETLLGEYFSYVHNILMRIEHPDLITLCSPNGKTVSSAVLDCFLHH